MSTEDEVRTASERFYAALSRMLQGDSSALADCWSHSAEVTAMHPIGAREVGWEAVRKSFEMVASLATDGKVGLQDQLIRVVGECAYEVGSEQGQAKFAGQQVSIDHRVTNIYRREAGAWKLIHHHTDLAPAMLEVLKP